MLERFVVDDAGFEFGDEGALVLELTLLRFLDLLNYARGTATGIVKWSGIWFVQGASGRTLSELLYSTTEIDRDLRLLVGGRLDKLRCWDDDDALNPPPEVRFGDMESVLAPGIALSVVAYHNGRGIACLTTDQAGRSGPVTVVVEGQAAGTVYFLVDSSDGPAFWRNLVDLEDLDEDSLAHLSPLAFPRLRFAARTWRQVSRFEGSYRDVRDPLIRSLSGLNDYGLEIWREFTEPARISAEMAARARVDCSRDSPQTHRNASAMGERKVEFEGETVTCEWHTKLEPHRNRIHFAILDDCVLIGVFGDHLTT